MRLSLPEQCTSQAAQHMLQRPTTIGTLLLTETAAVINNDALFSLTAQD